MKKFSVIIVILYLVFSAALVLAAPQESPNKPWPKNMFETLETSKMEEKNNRPWLVRRLLDFLDIFRLDVGVGPSYGIVVRPTEYLQAGYRKFNPVSARVGLMGRRSPVLIERTNEMGFSLGYLEAPDRKACDFELGLGLDLFIAGGYAALCPVEIFDFFGGIFDFDPKKDD
jgi:hypothetical protein